MRSLLVTNDFPPKVGGIQSYLWELWRRLPGDEVAVLTTPQPGAASFDAEAARHGLTIVRTAERVLLPRRSLVRRIDDLARRLGAGLVLLDPALPLGLIGTHLAQPYGVVLHGAEVTVPGRLPGSRSLLAAVLRGAMTVIAAGGYPAAEAERAAGRPLPVAVVPPGVDSRALMPLSSEHRHAARQRLGLPPEARLVVSMSRLVPRKGMDVLVRAAAQVAMGRPDMVVAIGGSGRDRRRLERLVVTTGAPVRLLGRLSDDDRNALYGCGDLFAMLCRDRWAGLEQEGFGIVFLEAGAAGLASIAGASGGAAEAVVEGETGEVVARPHDVRAVAPVLARLLDDEEARASMGATARRRVVEEFDYEVLAGRLRAALLASMAPQP